MLERLPNRLSQGSTVPSSERYHTQNNPSPSKSEFELQNRWLCDLRSDTVSDSLGLWGQLVGRPEIAVPHSSGEARDRNPPQISEVDGMVLPRAHLDNALVATFQSPFSAQTQAIVVCKVLICCIRHNAWHSSVNQTHLVEALSPICNRAHIIAHFVVLPMVQCSHYLNSGVM